jgi:hypothetical protein
MWSGILQLRRKYMLTTGPMDKENSCSFQFLAQRDAGINKDALGEMEKCYSCII